jgi:hypothetical protein
MGRCLGIQRAADSGGLCFHSLRAPLQRIGGHVVIQSVREAAEHLQVFVGEAGAGSVVAVPVAAKPLDQTRRNLNLAKKLVEGFVSHA